MKKFCLALALSFTLIASVVGDAPVLDNTQQTVVGAYLRDAPLKKLPQITQDTRTQTVVDFEKIISSVAEAQAKEPMCREQLLLFIARALKGTPYAAQTLEVGTEETLVVNLRQLDCTTYVETVVALYLCINNGTRSYTAFQDCLRRIRYAGGRVAYTSRLHYFSQWIEANSREGIVTEVQKPSPPFSSIQRLAVDFMTTHSSLYPRLRSLPNAMEEIRSIEKGLSGKETAYIPKNEIRNDSLLRATVRNGDILAIVTTKKGLDIAHVGFAVWHSDGLHLLNASQTHRKVVEEPLPLRTYMKKHPSQSGIRVVRIN